MMTKEIALAFIVIILPLCSCAQAPDKQSKNLEYLQHNFKELYSTDYDQFWKILRGAAAGAQGCKVTTDTARFLELARINSINAEFNEFFNREIEQLAVRKTVTVNRDLVRTVVYISHPVRDG